MIEETDYWEEEADRESVLNFDGGVEGLGRELSPS